MNEFLFVGTTPGTTVHFESRNVMLERGPILIVNSRSSVLFKFQCIFFIISMNSADIWVPLVIVKVALIVSKAICDSCQLDMYLSR